MIIIVFVVVFRLETWRVSWQLWSPGPHIGQPCAIQYN